MTDQNYDSIILDHYSKEAKSLGASKESTLRDHTVRDAETQFIFTELSKAIGNTSGARVLELGSGNGYTLSTMAPQFPNALFDGIEFSPDLLEIAKARNIDNVTFSRGDCRQKAYPEETFDAVISQRVLINLMDRHDQEQALREIFCALKRGGTYIMIEAFSEPLEALNAARAELELPAIAPAHHNLNFETDALLEFLDDLGFARIETEMRANHLSTHYFVCRVLHELVRPEHGAIRNTLFAQFFDAALPAAIGDYSSIKFYAFRKPA